MQVSLSKLVLCLFTNALMASLRRHDYFQLSLLLDHMVTDGGASLQQWSRHTSDVWFCPAFIVASSPMGCLCTWERKLGDTLGAELLRQM